MTERITDQIRVHPHRERGYATIDLAALEDPALSWKAKGLYYYLSTQPPTGEITDEDLLARATDSPDATRSALKELEDHKYVSLTPA